MVLSLGIAKSRDVDPRDFRFQNSSEFLFSKLSGRFLTRSACNSHGLRKQGAQSPYVPFHISKEDPHKTPPNQSSISLGSIQAPIFDESQRRFLQWIMFPNSGPIHLRRQDTLLRRNPKTMKQFWDTLNSG